MTTACVHELKNLVAVGDSLSGVTSLLHRVTNHGSYSWDDVPPFRATYVVVPMPKTVSRNPGEKVELHVVEGDLGVINPHRYDDAHVVVVVYSVYSRRSYEKASDLVAQVRRFRRDVPICVVECDAGCDPQYLDTGHVNRARVSSLDFSALLGKDRAQALMKCSVQHRESIRLLVNKVIELALSQSRPFTPSPKGISRFVPKLFSSSAKDTFNTQSISFSASTPLGAVPRTTPVHTKKRPVSESVVNNTRHQRLSGPHDNTKKTISTVDFITETAHEDKTAEHQPQENDEEKEEEEEEEEEERDNVQVGEAGGEGTTEHTTHVAVPALTGPWYTAVRNTEEKKRFVTTFLHTKDNVRHTRDATAISLNTLSQRLQYDRVDLDSAMASMYALVDETAAAVASLEASLANPAMRTTYIALALHELFCQVMPEELVDEIAPWRFEYEMALLSRSRSLMRLYDRVHTTASIDCLVAERVNQARWRAQLERLFDSLPRETIHDVALRALLCAAFRALGGGAGGHDKEHIASTLVDNPDVHQALAGGATEDEMVRLAHEHTVGHSCEATRCVSEAARHSVSVHDAQSTEASTEARRALRYRFRQRKRIRAVFSQEEALQF